MSADIVDRITHSTAPKKNRRQLSGVAQFWLIFRYISLTIILAMVILPIYVLVVNSFKGISGVYLNTAFELPKTLNFETWSAAWDWLAVPMGRTLLFVTQSSIISALIGSINGYVLSKWRFAGSNVVFMLFLFGMFIPYQAIMIPLTQFNKLLDFDIDPGVPIRIV
jgi:glucose/mannose transport system permease protein